MAPVDRSRTEVGIQADRVTDVGSTDFPGYYFDEDNSWNLEEFKKKLNIKITSLDDLNMTFDISGIDASIVNAFRRILIAEIPTLAIEFVYIINNTSILQDEVLSHRLGLIPLKADPDMFKWFVRPGPGMEATHTDYDTVVFSLNVKCDFNKEAAPGETDPKKLYLNSEVLSGELVWKPQGRQAERFADNPLTVVNPNIVVAKLRPGQEIDLEAHAILGIGQDHAKFSPVSTASYRLLPAIHILEPIEGEDAIKFQKCFPAGVIELEDGPNGKPRARVADVRKDTVSRECLRHPEFADKVQLGRVRDYFLYSIESTGIIKPDQLFLKSIAVLKSKCMAVKASVEGLGTTE
ncbi:DNA-directed RNA polymerase I and III subunit Rpc40 [Schizosaccharomyces japonicus yFS275]|uniref:DNA-directed RNA polymerases I and III subunit RPAC1 n=1 Tax=Schizosaccharomyces japonicus (strain yFS275 / FY16936) TaxID=402676 RepID=B6JXY4_SCHJY|nr:DNA-directed RNA polymerase I and III subunit Rpc40 [Schizosaccharomyces japonicus yFS275]EEB06402.1 DNA-directed RNA polymerase I and III subunit Rpc40 [Schizosaccharomyces japonicus yFS275]